MNSSFVIPDDNFVGEHHVAELTADPVVQLILNKKKIFRSPSWEMASDCDYVNMF